MTPPHFDIFVIIYLLKRNWPFILTNLNFLYPRIICTKFDWIWAAGSGEEDFFLKISVILLSRNYLPLHRDNPLHLYKLEFPSPKDDLCYVWLKLAQWFFRKRFLNDPTPILHFCNYLPLEEDLALYLNKLEFPSLKDNVYQVWLNLGIRFWRRRFLKIFSVFLLFRYYLPLERGSRLHLNILEFPSPRMICAKSG
jgi:hypothetical protein